MQEVALKARLLNGVAWLAVTRTLGQGISWAITIYVARILSPDDYGLMGMVGLFIGFVALFNELGFGAVIIQKKELAGDELSTICWGLISINLAFYVVSFLAAPSVAWFFQEPRLTSIVRTAAVSFIISGLGITSYYLLARDMLFNNRSQAEFLGSLAGSVSALLFASLGFGVWSLVYSNLVLELTKNLLFLVFYPVKPALRFSFKKIKGDVNFGLQVAVARLIWYVYTNADFLIAARVLGKTFLGYYSMAFQFASIPIDKLVSLVTQVAFPAFSTIQTDNKLLERYFLKIVRWVACLTFPIFLGVFLVAEDAVYLFLSDKWAPMILPLKVLCIASTLRTVNAINAPLVLAKGKGSLVVLNNLILAIVLVTAFFVGSLYGSEAFSYAWLVFPAPFLITTRLTLNVIGVSLADYFKELKHPIQGALFMASIVAISQGTLLRDAGEAGRLSVSTAIGLTSYALYFAVFNRRIFSEFKSVIKR